jgi:hypothetical protein
MLSKARIPVPGWLLAALAASLAVGRALSAASGGSNGSVDAATRRAIFGEIEAGEPQARDEAARAFPGDPWSADDDFHNQEKRQVIAIAARRKVPIEAVLEAIDDGLREHWDEPDRALPIATVPPCHPRPDY